MEILLITIFALGYLAIAFEQLLKINKAASALLTGVLCWTVYVLFSADKHTVSRELTEHLGSFSGILFFLMCAMTIVELIDAHDGFDIVTDRIKTTSKRKLLWIIGFLTFFLSAALDNLTATIVMTSVTRKLVPERAERLVFIGLIVIAANAGGAWSPIGDVTTTMLWIGGQISSGNIILKLIIPSLICLLAPLLAISLITKGTVPKRKPAKLDHEVGPSSVLERNAVFVGGLGMLMLVPVFKTVTHLPPYMGMLLALGVLWVLNEIIHRGKRETHRTHLSVVQALQQIDIPSILFFLGILVAISALESTHLLERLALLLSAHIQNQSLIVIAIGLLSAIVDNVPLVAATMGMYDLKSFPMDHYLWEFIAYCSGTGGSILIIGTAAGVAAMGMERINFFWYLKKIGWLAALGFFAGAGAFMLQNYLFG